MRRVKCAPLLLTALLLSACHFFDDTDELMSLVEHASDSDTDSRTGTDSEGNTETPSDAPSSDASKDTTANSLVCAEFCERFVACALELNTPDPMSVDTCTESCVVTDWGKDACGQCYFACDMNLVCTDYYRCLEDCPCDDLS